MTPWELPLSPKALKLLRDLAIVVLVVAALLGGLSAYARTWPPLVVVESGSMQHSDNTSFLGVIDTGDIVLVQAVSGPEEVVTYVEGRARGYGTYGDYGDVLVFTVRFDPQAIIHRPLFRTLWNGTAEGLDVPALLELERGTDWNVTADGPFGLRTWDTVTLYNVTPRDLIVTVPMGLLAGDPVARRCAPDNPCYVTMGDNNAPEVDRALVRQSWVVGRARGEVPWLGLLKLGFTGTYAWGDPAVPANSWTGLLGVLAVAIGVPVAYDVVRHLRHQRRRDEAAGPEGGLEEVVSSLEERWRRRAGEDEENTAPEESPPDGGTGGAP